jgi:hypothetical protein
MTVPKLCVIGLSAVSWRLEQVYRDRAPSLTIRWRSHYLVMWTHVAHCEKKYQGRHITWLSSSCSQGRGDQHVGLHGPKFFTSLRTRSDSDIISGIFFKQIHHRNQSSVTAAWNPICLNSVPDCRVIKRHFLKCTNASYFWMNYLKAFE